MHALLTKLWRGNDYTKLCFFLFFYHFIKLFFYWGKCALHTNCTEIVIFYCIYLKTGCFEIKTSTTKFPVKCGIFVFICCSRRTTRFTCIFSLFFFTTRFCGHSSCNFPFWYRLYCAVSFCFHWLHFEFPVDVVLFSRSDVEGKSPWEGERSSHRKEFFRPLFCDFEWNGFESVSSGASRLNLN